MAFRKKGSMLLAGLAAGAVNGLFGTGGGRKEFIGLLPVAAPVGQLQIIPVTWMPTFCDRNDVVNTRRQWVRIPHTEIHRLTANTTQCLGCVNFLFSPFKGKSVCTVLVWSLNGHDL